MSQSDLWSCKQALNNPDIDDSALLRLFRACDDAKGLLHAVVEANDERSLRLLLADRVDLSHLYRDNGTLLHVAYRYANLRIIDLLLDAGLKADAADENGVLPWHMAAHNEDESVIARAIANGIDVNFVDARGSALVHFAAMNDNGKVMAALMAAGADVSVKDSHGQTPLHLAAYLNCPATVAQLVSVPCDANAVDESGNTPLLLAIKNHCSSDKLFKMLLDAGASVCAENDNSPYNQALRELDDELLAFMIDNVPEIDVNVAEREQGMTAMHVAVRRNNPELVATLIAAGADVNALNKAGESPLLMFGALYCVAEDDVAAARVVRLLIDANADVGARDRHGLTACHHLANCGYERAIELLIAAGANVSARARRLTDETPLFFARNAQMMSVLIAANADVNARDRYNNTSCHAVCQREIDSATRVKLLAVLRAAGADMHAKNSNGETPLHLAAEMHSVDVLEALVDAKTDLSVRDWNGNSVWHRAVHGNRVENLKFLLGFNDGSERINIRNSAGQTLLYFAASFTHVQPAMVKLLLDAGADPHARATDGSSALEIALVGDDERKVKLLLRAGASARAVNSHGVTACHLAARFPANAAKAVRLLVRAGASVKAISDDGRTPAHGAHATALPVLRAHGANLDAADNDGNTPCHIFRDGVSLSVLFGLGANMRAVNRQVETPCAYAIKLRVADRNMSDDALELFAASGAAVGVPAMSRFGLISAILSAGGASVPKYPFDRLDFDEEVAALSCLCARQKQLFRLRAFQVCVGLQSLRVSALEMCEILSQMFAPLESMVPFDFAWRVVVAVKHFKR